MRPFAAFFCCVSDASKRKRRSIENGVEKPGKPIKRVAKVLPLALQRKQNGNS